MTPFDNTIEKEFFIGEKITSSFSLNNLNSNNNNIKNSNNNNIRSNKDSESLLGLTKLNELSKTSPTAFKRSRNNVFDLNKLNSDFLSKYTFVY